MSNDSPVTKMLLRRDTLAAQVGKRESEILILKQELAELETALRVISKFDGAKALTSQKLSVKPLPEPHLIGLSMTAMILRLVREAPNGLNTEGIISGVRDRWKPSATPDDIRPLVWRLWKKQAKLDRDEKRVYRLPKQVTAPQK